MIEDKEHDALVEKNQWLENLDEVVAFIKAASAEQSYTAEGSRIPGQLYWSWCQNTRCKYVTLRIDMRDGGFVLTDRDGKRISLKQLQWQVSHDEA